MLGLSFSEILLIAAVAAVAWFAWSRARRIAARPGQAAKRGGGPDRPVEDMVKCPVCDLYVPAKAPRPCDRADCPYRG